MSINYAILDKLTEQYRELQQQSSKLFEQKISKETYLNLADGGLYNKIDSIKIMPLGLTGNQRGCGCGCESECKSKSTCCTMVNRTVFVDQKFGTALGIRETESKPFQTLSQGLAAALPGDTIYVRPGVYNDGNLVLIDNVNWYFEEGAIVQSIAPIFLDLSGSVTSSISGWGIFKSNSSILSIVNGSKINFQANLIELSGSALSPVAAISITSSSISNINIDVNEIHSANANAVRINGPSNINLTSDFVTGLSTLIAIDTNANGYGNFNIKYIENSSSISSSPLIYNNSISFKFDLQNSVFISDVATHAIQIQPSTPIMENLTNISINLMRVTNGVLFVKGSPTSNLMQDAPKVNIEIKTLANIMSSESIIEPIHLEYGVINFKSSLVIHVGNPLVTFINSPNFVQLDINIDEALSVTSDWFNFTNSDTNSSNIVINGHSIFLINGSFLTINSNINANINFNQIRANVTAVGRSAILINSISAIDPNNRGRVTINAASLSLAIVGGNETYQAVIDHIAGDFSINSTYYEYMGNSTGQNPSANTIGIDSHSDRSIIDINSISTGDINGIVFQTSAFSLLRSDNINANSNVLVVKNNGSLEVNVGKINTSGFGIGLDVNDQAGVSGSINSIYTQDGSVLRTTTIGNVLLTFNEFSTQGGIRDNSNQVIAPSGTCLDLIGDGDVRLVGSNINVNYCHNGIYVQNGCELTLQIGNIFASWNNSIIKVDANGGGAFIDFLHIAGGGAGELIEAAISLQNGVVSLKGGAISIGANNVNGPSINSGPLFLIENNVHVDGVFQQVSAPTAFIVSTTHTNAINIEFATLSVGDSGSFGSTNHAIHLISPSNAPNSNVSITGGNVYVNTQVPNDIFMYVNGNTMVHSTFGIINSPVNILNIGTGGSLFFVADRLSVNNFMGYNDSVIYINSPTANTRYTIGGDMFCNGDYAIQFDVESFDHVTKLLSSVLVANVNSIYNPGSIKKVVIVPSIANNPTSGVNEVPVSALIIDANVE